MFKRGPFDFGQFQRQNNAGNVYDAEFTESEPKEPKKRKNCEKTRRIVVVLYINI